MFALAGFDALWRFLVGDRLLAPFEGGVSSFPCERGIPRFAFARAIVVFAFLPIFSDRDGALFRFYRYGPRCLSRRAYLVVVRPSLSLGRDFVVPDV